MLGGKLVWTSTNAKIPTVTVVTNVLTILVVTGVNVPLGTHSQAILFHALMLTSVWSQMAAVLTSVLTPQARTSVLVLSVSLSEAVTVSILTNAQLRTEAVVISAPIRLVPPSVHVPKVYCLNTITKPAQILMSAAR